MPLHEGPVKVLFVYGTRPEAIKLAPLVRHLSENPEFTARVCVTGQHRKLLDSALAVFGMTPHFDLNAMLPGQTLFQSTARMIGLLEDVLKQEQPDFVVVQGDTTSTFCGALAAFYANVPVGHVEAGLRTGDMRQPFPEEMNRVLTGRLAERHYAPTAQSAAHLLAEGVAQAKISITGNTGIDAVLYIAGRLERGELKPAVRLDWPAGRKLVLVTAHRRESFGPGFVSICEAIAELASRGEVHVIYPVHPNPNVQAPVSKYLAGRENITLVEPLDYLSFVDLMRRAHILLTDSGGVQEEGPSLGKPVLVMREKTERPEAVEAGTARLTGTDRGRIVAEAALLLEDEAEYLRRSRIHNPYGDGRASERIGANLAAYFERASVGAAEGR
jgi:UDP-N-acetylglucosamine 2-epimerase (non-hydrolysing)